MSDPNIKIVAQLDMEDIDKKLNALQNNIYKIDVGINSSSLTKIEQSIESIFEIETNALKSINIKEDNMGVKASNLTSNDNMGERRPFWAMLLFYLRRPLYPSGNTERVYAEMVT